MTGIVTSLKRQLTVRNGRNGSKGLPQNMQVDTQQFTLNGCVRGCIERRITKHNVAGTDEYYSELIRTGCREGPVIGDEHLTKGVAKSLNLSMGGSLSGLIELRRGTMEGL